MFVHNHQSIGLRRAPLNSLKRIVYPSVSLNSQVWADCCRDRYEQLNYQSDMKSNYICCWALPQEVPLRVSHDHVCPSVCPSVPNTTCLACNSKTESCRKYTFSGNVSCGRCHWREYFRSKGHS